MMNKSTTDKLIAMHLTTMADSFIIQMEDPRMKDVPFDDRFGMLVDMEYNSRKNNRFKRLVKKASLEQPNASILDIDYSSGRKLNRQLITRLASCEYITEFRNIFITGATGCGKTYMACAFGLEACKQFYNVKYVRLPDLLLELDMARSSGDYVKVLKMYANPTLLIIDEWLLLKLNDTESKDVFELIHKRRKRSSTIFCSQYSDDEWYERLGGDNNPLAEAIMDRIKFDSYKIDIRAIDPEHDRSMREVYGMSLSEAQ